LESKIRGVSQQLDDDGSGSISTRELDEMLNMLGMEEADRREKVPILVAHMDEVGWQRLVGQGAWARVGAICTLECSGAARATRLDCGLTSNRVHALAKRS